MKRFIAVLSSLLVLPAFAEVAPIYYDEIIEYSEDENSDINTAENSANVVQPVAQPSAVSPRVTTGGRAAASRIIPATGNTAGTSSRGVSARATAATRNATQARTGVQSRTATAPVATRTNTARTATNTSARSASLGRVSARPSRAAATANTIPSTITAARRASAPNMGANTARSASLVQTDTVNAPLYTGRVSTRTSAVMARAPSAGVAGTNVTTSATVSADEAISTAEQLEYMESLTTIYKERYQQCMDNYCNKLSEEQGRCTCSKNIKNYAEIENALKVANEEYTNAVVKLAYLKLDPSDIEAIFEETATELAMSGKTDNSDLAADIDAVRKTMREIETPKASSSATYATTSSTGSFFNPSALLNGEGLEGLIGFNLFGNTTTTADTSSINNQRGDQLYKTATARCKAAVLNEAQSKGVDIAVITNSYDIAIDKDCISYERLLEENNEAMKNKVFVAEIALQNARVGISRNKNSNDLRGCVNALDSCMQDEFICGADYEYCLDPTGKYIVNGEIVIGSTPGYEISDDDTDTELGAKPVQWNTGLYETWAYGSGNKSPWIGDGTLAEYINESIADQASTNENMAQFLQSKIGYIDEDGTSYGMCAQHLKTCQAYTFEDDEYIPDNRVIKEYLNRTLTKIKVAQDNLLAEHAEECVTDVTKCLQNNNYDWTNSQSPKSNIAINACKAQITTCMSVNGHAASEPTPNSMREWVYDTQVIFVDQGSLQTQCENSGGKFNAKTYDCTCPLLSVDEGAYCAAVPYAEYKNGKYTCINGYTRSNGACEAKAGTYKTIELDDNGGKDGMGKIYYHINTGYHSNTTCTSPISRVDVPTIDYGTFDGYYIDGNEYIDESGYIIGAVISNDITWTAQWDCDNGAFTSQKTCPLTAGGTNTPNTSTGGTISQDGTVERTDIEQTVK